MRRGSEVGARSSGPEGAVVQHVRKRRYTEPITSEPSKLEHLSPRKTNIRGSKELLLARHFTAAKNAAYFIPYYTDAEDVALQFDKFVDFIGQNGIHEVRKILLPMLLKLGQRMLQHGCHLEDVRRFVGDRMPARTRNCDPCTLTMDEIHCLSLGMLRAKLTTSALETRFVSLDHKKHRTILRYLELECPFYVLEVLNEVKFVLTEERQKGHQVVRKRSAPFQIVRYPVLSKRAMKFRWGRVEQKPIKRRNPQTREYLTDFENAVKELTSSPPMTLPSIKLYAARNCFQGLASACLSPDQRFAALGFENSSIEVWSLLDDVDIVHSPSNLKTVRLMRHAVPHKDPEPKQSDHQTLLGHRGPVFATAFVPYERFIFEPKSTGAYLLSASEDTTVKLWSVDTCKDIVTYRGHSMPVFCVKPSASGLFFVSGSMDNNCILWRYRKSHAIRAFVGHKQAITALSIHPNEQYIFTGSADRDIRMWSVNTGATVRLFSGSRSTIFCMQTAPDGRTLVSTGEDRKLRLWDLRTSKEVRSFRGHGDTVYSVDVSADSRFFVSGGMDGSVRVWDARASGYAASKASLNGEESPTDMELSDSMIGYYQTACSCVLNVEYTAPGVVTGIGNYCDK